MVDEALIDLTQDRTMLRTLYAPPPGDFSIVVVPKLPFAILDGEGPPERASIEVAVKALYTSIYAIRREARERMGKSFVEPPVEMVYWADDMDDLAAGNREKWHWRVLITLPVWADAQRLKNRLLKRATNWAMIPLFDGRFWLKASACSSCILAERTTFRRFWKGFTATTCHRKG